jgi:peptidoglycan/LPS O-acetylase OafA/YrhL
MDQIYPFLPKSRSTLKLPVMHRPVITARHGDRNRSERWISHRYLTEQAKREASLKRRHIMVAQTEFGAASQVATNQEQRTHATSSQRLYFVDWLRVWLIVSVVAHHSAEAYVAGLGGWPFKDPSTTPLLIPMMRLNAAYFMGFFFLISGYFLEGSYDRNGGWAFIKIRLIRLGIPLIIIVVILFGYESYATSGTEFGYMRYMLTVYMGQQQLEFAHLWFITHLLFYALVYAVWRAVVPRTASDKGLRPPGHISIFLYALALAVTGALVRQVYPQNTWVDFLWIIPVEPAHLPQYLSLFVLGIAAGRGGWFTKINNKTAYVWFSIGLAAFLWNVFDLGFPQFVLRFLNGRAIWGILEAFICIGMILGLLVIFRNNVSTPSTLVKRLAGSVYGVYVLHVFAVFGFQAIFLGIDLHALIKFPIVLACSLVVTFVAVDLLRKIPGVAKVI